MSNLPARKEEKGLTNTIIGMGASLINFAVAKTGDAIVSSLEFAKKVVYNPHAVVIGLAATFTSVIGTDGDTWWENSLSKNPDGKEVAEKTFIGSALGVTGWLAYYLYSNITILWSAFIWAINYLKVWGEWYFPAIWSWEPIDAILLFMFGNYAYDQYKKNQKDKQRMNWKLKTGIMASPFLWLYFGRLECFAIHSTITMMYAMYEHLTYKEPTSKDEIHLLEMIPPDISIDDSAPDEIIPDIHDETNDK